MNDVAALTLLNLIEQTWPTPRWTNTLSDAWHEDLMTLDEGAAGTAFVQLRRTLTDRPTFAVFASATRALTTRDGGSSREKCAWCDDTGWVPGDLIDMLPTTTSSVKPCPECDFGVSTKATHDRYLQSIGAKQKFDRVA